MSDERIDVLLVANRGEIALRVMRTARALGMTCVAVYSEADADAPHVAFADRAVCIGAPPSRESYLAIDRVLEAARRAGAQAIHPGYGFLSENPVFAQRCVEAGLVFVGPPASAMRMMGDKIEAKRRMIEAGVPTAPAYLHVGDGDGEGDLARLHAEAERIGYPVLVKAAAGGGGRGMRIVRRAAELAEGIAGARSEAANAFGSGSVFLEKLIEHARHIEIQVFADTHGNVIHLGERECSVQRRHQKIIEEAPSAAVSPDLRARMGDAAVAAARAIGYVGAGTVEFLLDDRALDDDGLPRFYFLEMNTRLQVEHPVTEIVVRQDLVAWQLRVAQGERLPLSQHEVDLVGHAIEVRLYAEDPYAGFLPQTGQVLRWRPASHGSARVDAGIVQGQAVSPYYDPMLAKIIGSGRTRAEAIRAVRKAVADSVIFGVGTNRGFLLSLLESAEFADNALRTDTLDARIGVDAPTRPRPSGRAWALAAWLAADGQAHGELAHWRSSGEYPASVKLRCGDEERVLSVHVDRTGRASVAGAAATPVELRVHGRRDGEVACEHDGVRRWIDVLADGDELWIDDDGHAFAFVEVHAGASGEDAGSGDGIVRAPMGGRVLAVAAVVGAVVRKGETLAVIEAMKMEHRVLAPYDGTVRSVGVQVGGQVAQRAILATLEPTSNEPEPAQ